MPDRKRCFLVVDDEPRVRSLMGRIVASAFPGAEIREAADGSAALDLLDEEVACIISDIEMPEMDGLRLCWTLRNTPAFKPFQKVPVILVTGLGPAEDARERAWHAGTALFLEKPFEAREVARLISRSTGLEAAIPPRSPLQFNPGEAILTEQERNAIVASVGRAGSRRLAALR